MKISVLDASTLGTDLDLSPLSAFGDVVLYNNTTKEETPLHSMDSDVLIINKVKINETTLPDTGKVKLICLFATGYDNIDTAYCKKRGIGVCNVVGYSTNSVSQVCVAIALNLLNNLKTYTKYVESGEYTASGVANHLVPPYNELNGKVWGIVGCGNIGKAVAKVAKALGCKVLANTRSGKTDFENVDLKTLCQKSDIITIHAPLSDETRGLIGKNELSLMKKNVVIVNVARGAVTDEEAIAQAIKKGVIGAFGADVFSVEPFSKEHPFYEIKDYDNVCLTPHMAWSAYEARERCLNEIVENITSFLNGGTRNRVD